MSLQAEWVAFSTIVRKEARRFLRIWSQTLLPPAISMSLYFIIFGSLIGSRIGSMGGYSYMQFMVPGLIMMAVLTNAYSNVVSSFFGAKFQRHIEELLVSPTSNHTILLGFVVGGVMRGICVGAIVTVLSLFFSKLHIQHVGITILILLLTSLLFSLLGFINAVYANNFDDISIVPTFVLTPLTYLGGVFLFDRFTAAILVGPVALESYSLYRQWFSLRLPRCIGCECRLRISHRAGVHRGCISVFHAFIALR